MNMCGLTTAGAVLALYALTGVGSYLDTENVEQAASPAEQQTSAEALAELTILLAKATAIYQVGDTTIVQYCRKSVSKTPYEWKFHLKGGSRFLFQGVQCNYA